jgi:hypothetical protein
MRKFYLQGCPEVKYFACGVTSWHCKYIQCTVKQSDIFRNAFNRENLFGFITVIVMF